MQKAQIAKLLGFDSISRLLLWAISKVSRDRCDKLSCRIQSSDLDVEGAVCMKRSQISMGYFLKLAFTIAVSLSIFQACGSDDITETGGSAYDQLWTSLFENCGTCHGAGFAGTVGGPDLSDKSSFISALSGKKGSDFPSWDTFNANRQACLDQQFLVPGDASSSMLLAIFSPSAASSVNCSVDDHTSIPQNLSVSSSVLEDLTDWINAGAKP